MDRTRIRPSARIGGDRCATSVPTVRTIVGRAARRVQIIRHSAADRIRPGPQRLLFVTGAYRSGTTAVVRWLGDHPDVMANSESRALVALHELRNTERRFSKLHRHGEDVAALSGEMLLSLYHVTSGHSGAKVALDKEPLGPDNLAPDSYDRFVADVLETGRDTRVVFMVRDPVSTAWSMSQRTYGHSLTAEEPYHIDLATHLEHWNAAARTALAFGDHPRVLTCSFGELSDQPAEGSRRIAAFARLDELEPFPARPTAAVGFEPDVLAQVHAATGAMVTELAAAGIDVAHVR